MSRPSPQYVPVGPVAEHVGLLRQARMSYTLIAAKSGCSRTMITRIARGKRTWILSYAARRVLAVPLLLDERQLVDSVPVVRRLRALVAYGHTQAQICATDPGVSLRIVSDLLAGRRSTVQLGTARRVQEIYDRLRTCPGTHAPSIERGRHNGWPTPQAWGAEIDDPGFEPTPWRPANRRRSSAVAEETAFLRECGMPDAQIAELLGMRLTDLQRQLRRAAAAEQSQPEPEPEPEREPAAA